VLPAAGTGGKPGFLGRSASSWLCDLPIVRTQLFYLEPTT
jgi:hypothetical protein